MNAVTLPQKPETMPLSYDDERVKKPLSCATTEPPLFATVRVQPASNVGILWGKELVDCNQITTI